MKIDLTVATQHLARIEGHGTIFVRVSGGVVCEARWEVVETPRFFEVMLKGRHYSEAPLLAARICGICSIGHCLASLRATEAAFGTAIPETARKLRLLALHGELLQSHYLHLFFLAAPDFLSLESALPLLASRPDIVHLAGRLKGVGNRVSELAAGRSTHPVSLKAGGVARMPSRERLLAVRDDLARSLDDIRQAGDLFGSFTLPDFVRETEYVSLKGEGSYPWAGGRLVSSDNVEAGEEEYLAMTNEYLPASGTSKWCRLSRPSYAVGALARFNNNHRFLHPEAAALAARLGLAPPCHNPFMNTYAQLVECLHVTHEAMGLLEELAGAEGGQLAVAVQPSAGTGTGAVEVPRGILYHHYEYDAEGYVVRADCVIPTTQNNANIHFDLPELTRRFARHGMTDEELERLCAMLVRAYDPCLSCAVH